MLKLSFIIYHNYFPATNILSSLLLMNSNFKYYLGLGNKNYRGDVT